MPASATNPFVLHLSRHTAASPDHEVAFGEFITQQSLPSEKPLRLETETRRSIRTCFQCGHPPSIILTTFLQKL